MFKRSRFIVLLLLVGLLTVFISSVMADLDGSTQVGGEPAAFPTYLIENPDDPESSDEYSKYFTETEIRDQFDPDTEACAATSGTTSGQAFSRQAFSAQAFSAQAFSAQAFSAQAFSAQAFSAQAFSAQAFSAQAFSAQAFSAQAFSAQAFSAQAFSRQAFSRQAFYFGDVGMNFSAEAAIEALVWQGQDFSFMGENNPKGTEAYIQSLFDLIVANGVDGFEQALDMVYTTDDFLDQLEANAIPATDAEAWAQDTFANLLAEVGTDGLANTAIIILDEFEDDESGHGNFVEDIYTYLAQESGVEVGYVRRVDVTEAPIDFIARNIALAIEDEINALEAIGVDNFILNMSWASLPCTAPFSIDGENWDIWEFDQEVKDREEDANNGGNNEPLDVVPIAQCGYTLDNGSASYLRFGYDNPNDDSVFILAEPDDNTFIVSINTKGNQSATYTAESVNIYLPELFQSGEESSAFEIPYDLSANSVTWTLEGIDTVAITPEWFANNQCDDWVEFNTFEKNNKVRGNYCNDREGKTHPVGQRIANEYQGVSYADVLSLFCDDGLGWGKIRRLFAFNPPELAVTPVLECVVEIDGGFIAQFGYSNPNLFSVYLEADESVITVNGNLVSLSALTPEPATTPRSYPSYLHEGDNIDVFTVTYSSGDVEWTLKNVNGDAKTVSTSIDTPETCIIDDDAYNLSDYLDDAGFVDGFGEIEMVGLFFGVEEIAGESLQVLRDLLDGYTSTYNDDASTSSKVLAVAASGNYGPIVRTFTGSFFIQSMAGLVGDGADVQILTDDDGFEYAVLNDNLSGSVIFDENGQPTYLEEYVRLSYEQLVVLSERYADFGLTFNVAFFQPKDYAPPLTPAIWESTLSVGNTIGDGLDIATVSALNFLLDDGERFLFSHSADVTAPAAGYLLGGELIVGTSFAAPGVTTILGWYGDGVEAGCAVNEIYSAIDNPADGTDYLLPYPSDTSRTSPWANLVVRSGTADENPLLCNVAPNAIEDVIAIDATDILEIDGTAFVTVAESALLENDSDPNDDNIAVANSDENGNVLLALPDYACGATEISGLSYTLNDDGIPALSDIGDVTLTTSSQIVVNQDTTSFTFTAGENIAGLQLVSAFSSCDLQYALVTDSDGEELPVGLVIDPNTGLVFTNSFIAGNPNGLDVRTYTFSVEVSSSELGQSEVVDVEFVVNPPPISITGFEVIDLDTGNVLTPTGIDLAVTPNITIRANVSASSPTDSEFRPDVVGAVRFESETITINGVSSTEIFVDKFDWNDTTLTNEFLLSDATGSPLNILVGFGETATYTLKATPLTWVGTAQIPGTGPQADTSASPPPSITITVINSNAISGYSILVPQRASCEGYLSDLDDLGTGQTLDSPLEINLNKSRNNLSPGNYKLFTSFEYPLNGDEDIEILASAIGGAPAISGNVQAWVANNGCQQAILDVDANGNPVVISARDLEPYRGETVIIRVAYSRPNYEGQQSFTFDTLYGGMVISSITEDVIEK